MIGDENRLKIGLSCLKNETLAAGATLVGSNMQNTSRAVPTSSSSSEHQQAEVRSMLRSSTFSVQTTPPQREHRSPSLSSIYYTRKGVVAAKIRNVAARAYALAAELDFTAAIAAAAATAPICWYRGMQQQRQQFSSQNPAGSRHGPRSLSRQAWLIRSVRRVFGEQNAAVESHITRMWLLYI